MRIIIAFIFLMPVYIDAQTKYIAAYEGKIKFNFSQLNVGSEMNWKLTGAE